ncbi:uncharacterized protein TM35_000571210 [Trypanosoma theileri]|uniref:Mucin-associated surface protein (MASP) n=1 Tax=Trypanosoma theileri TaxID=67003 RepID=A0A1X0NH52_9TRYP|nr:uncharacterized protein TM35_000571210 [Trypanosoma theileri]ORC83793.1 hypothetical protein TM35_000571210 [Trypanosoma theileri]
MRKVRGKTFAERMLHRIFCLLALLLSVVVCVSVSAQGVSHSQAPSHGSVNAAAFSHLGGPTDVQLGSHGSGVPPHPSAPHAAIPGAPGVGPVPPARVGSHPGGAEAVAGVPGIDKPQVDVLVSPENPGSYPGPGFTYDNCTSIITGDNGKRNNSHCVPESSTTSRVAATVNQAPGAGKVPVTSESFTNAAIPGHPDFSGFKERALQRQPDAGAGGQMGPGVGLAPGVAVNLPQGERAQPPVRGEALVRDTDSLDASPQTPSNTVGVRNHGAVGANAVAAIPGFPGGYSDAGIAATTLISPTTPLGSHPGAGPVVSQDNGQVSGSANTQSGERDNHAENTMESSTSEVKVATANPGKGKENEVESDVQPPSQTSTAPPKGKSTRENSTTASTKASPSTPTTTTTTTTTLPPEPANNKKGDADSSSSISSSVWVRVPLLIVVTLACIHVC